MTNKKHIIAGVAVAATLLLVGSLVVDAALAFTRGREGDFVHFHTSARAVLDGENIYEVGVGIATERDVGGYIYPPLFAVILSPLGRLSLGAAGAVWVVVSGAMILASLVLLVRESWDRFGRPGAVAFVPVATVLTAVLITDKIRGVLRLGQTDSIMLAAVAGSLALLDRVPFIAGAVLGVAFNVKYQTLVFLPYLVVRRRWSAACGFVCGAVGAALSTALVFGWGRNSDYLLTGFAGLAEMLGISTGRQAAGIYPLEWGRSVSVPSTTARLSDWLGLGAGAGWAMAMLVAAAAFCTGSWMLRRHGVGLLLGRGPVLDATPQRRGVVALEWAGLALASLVFSPQTTSRHMLLIAAVIAPACVVALHTSQTRWGRRVLLAAFVVGALALTLPPGGYESDELRFWRGVGGVSWVWLVVYFVALWFGLRLCGTENEDEVME